MKSKSLFLIVGLIFVVVAIWAITSEVKSRKNCTQETTAVVVDYEKDDHIDSNGKRSNSYFPIVKYQVEGISYKEKYTTGSGRKKYKIEEEVQIAYNPNDVREFYIKGDKGPFLIGGVFIFLGTVAVIVGIKEGI